VAIPQQKVPPLAVRRPKHKPLVDVGRQRPGSHLISLLSPSHTDVFMELFRSLLGTTVIKEFAAACGMHASSDNVVEPDGGC
jgi:hypothetical protein